MARELSLPIKPFRVGAPTPIPTDTPSSPGGSAEMKKSTIREANVLNEEMRTYRNKSAGRHMQAVSLVDEFGEQMGMQKNPLIVEFPELAASMRELLDVMNQINDRLRERL